MPVKKHPTWLFFLLPLLVFFIGLATPLPHNIGLIFRYEFTSLIGLLIIIFTIVFHINGVSGAVIRLTAILISLGLPLSGLWSSAASEPGLIAGLLPYSDAMNYYQDALRLIQGMDFTSLATRRPIFTIWFAFLLLISGQNLQVALSFMVFSVGLGLITATYVLQKVRGKWAALIFTILIFLYYRRFIGIPASEHIGLLFGLIAFCLILMLIMKAISSKP